MENKDDKLRDACEQAAVSLKKINDPEYEDTASRLIYCVGSYNYDKNATGLREYGHKALILLNRAKEKNPRKVQKTVIKKLEDSLA
jgi:hypothetical protein